MSSSLYAELENHIPTGSPRVIIGVAGAPGAGKSTFVERFAAHLGSRAVVLPMDGFHLSSAQLSRLGRAERKGAPDTFDVDGYVCLLDRIRRANAPVFAPRFDRHLEESIAADIVIETGVPVVLTEGNYLLHDEHGWERVHGLLDATWWVDIDDETRRQRLIDRHVRYGRSLVDARAWVTRSDEANARALAGGRNRADLVIEDDERYVLNSR